MNEKEIKKLLGSYNMICAEIHQLEQEILHLSEVAAAHRELSAITYSDMPRGSGVSDPTYEKAQRIIDVYVEQVSKVERRIADLYDRKNQVEAFLEPLSDIEREIIRLRFFKKYKWEMVADSVHYSRRQCENILNNLTKYCKDMD